MFKSQVTKNEKNPVQDTRETEGETIVWGRRRRSIKRRGPVKGNPVIGIVPTVKN